MRGLNCLDFRRPVAPCFRTPRSALIIATFSIVLACVLGMSGVAQCAAQGSAKGSNQNVWVYQLKHAGAADLAVSLEKMLPRKSKIAVDNHSNSLIVMSTISGLYAIGEMVYSLDLEMPSETFHLDHADADAIAEKVRRILGESRGTIEPDARTHTIYVSTTPNGIERVRSLIADLDRPVRQVLIEADILDVASGKLKELGLQWELRLGYGDDNEAVINIGTGRANPDEPATGTVAFGTPSVTIPAAYDHLGGLITPAQTIPGSDFSATIQALVEDSSTKILSRPRILVIDGSEARFEVTTMEPYASSTFDDTGVASAMDIKFMDVGIILETTPHISDNGYVMLEVKQEVSTLQGEEFFDTTIIPDEGGVLTSRIRVPVKSQNRAATKVMVRDGQTIAIGGLKTSDDMEVVRKVPILGDIPILGVLFRSQSKSKGARELIIFITPHIISPDVSSPQVGMLSE